MKDKKSTKKQKTIKFLGIFSVIISLVLSSMELLWDHSPGSFDSGSHGQLWVGKHWVFFIADDANTGLEMYGWAHGELSDEWIIIH